MNTNNFNDFIAISPLSKTIRNELRPTEWTKQHIEEDLIISDDELKAEKRPELKELMDEYYREFIDEVLTQIGECGIEWETLFEAMKESIKSQTCETRKRLIKIQTDIRKQIYDNCAKRDEFKDLFSAKLITKRLPEYLEKKQGKDVSTELETVKLFERFATAFSDYFNTRKNIFSKEDISTSICHRIVHDNAAIFFDNINTFARIRKNAEKQIDCIEENNEKVLGDSKLADIFSYDFYNYVLRQSDIDYYNLICGVVNEYMNLYCQQRKEPIAMYRMKKLHKQILCKSESAFEIPHMYENDEEVYCSINSFISMLRERSVINRLIDIGENIPSYDLSKIYIKTKIVSNVSMYISHQWNLIELCQRRALDKKYKGNENKINDELKKITYYSIQDLINLVNQYYVELDNCQLEHEVVDYIYQIADTAQLLELKEFEVNSHTSLLSDEETATEIKEYLDKLMKIYHMLDCFYIDDFADKDIQFYSNLDEVYDDMNGLVCLYNKVRNYVTQKPYNNKKIKLNFGTPTLAAGWSLSKEFTNNTILLMKEGKYYLAIFNPKNKPSSDIIAGKSLIEEGNYYKKMVYNLLPGASKTLPHVFISSKVWLESHNVPEHILRGYAQKKHLKSSANFDIQFCRELIDYFKECIRIYPNYSCFDFSFSDTSDYNDISEFYREVEQQGYKIDWVYIRDEDINKLDREGKIYLFQIYNKDFSEGSKGTDNLHTMYLKNIFSEENLKDVVIKLNGEAELFFRSASIKNPITHKKGSSLVNRTYIEDGVLQSIPDEFYYEIYNYLNRKNCELSNKAKEYMDKASLYSATMDITKDRRYTVDKFFVHLPLTINFKVRSEINQNDRVLKYIAQCKDMHIIGIDRGERNLLYVSVIDLNGNIIKQKSFNIIESREKDKVRRYDYKSKLVEREDERQQSRKNWKKIGRIKDLKEGYLSQVVHEICNMVIEYSAIVVMEDLNYGFKRGRFKVERQVYQKFETMLINKLSYLVDKKKIVDEAGGLLRGYQLTYIPDKITNIGKQCGIIFYVPAAYTSKIDPTTGFVNVFHFADLTTVEKREQFIYNFDSIHYDTNKNLFCLSFDYNNFITHNTRLAKTKWTIYVHGERIKKYKGNYGFDDEFVNIEENIKRLMYNNGIDYSDGHNIIADISDLDVDNRKNMIADLIDIIKYTVQLRNSTSDNKVSTHEQWDRIISPVINESGIFYDSNDYIERDNAELPKDADANGAYCIALKGLYEVKQIKRNWRDDMKFNRELLKISQVDWFDFIQNHRY